MAVAGTATTSSQAVAPASQSQATKSSVRLAETFDNFLTLLTKQLQHQDPLSPMDTNQFTQQLVQFTGVEQAVATNKNLESLLSLLKGNSLADMVSFVGKTVVAKGASATFSGSPLEFGYELKDTAYQTKITIQDENGTIVYSTDGSTDAGSHKFTWDGRDSHGDVVGNGVYKIVVTPTDRGGVAQGVSTTVAARITGVELRDGAQMLMMGEVPVALADVKSIREQS
ncbi:MAG: flagellar hook assembly protein FlgD [Alphaproteobacteria bacterium]|nr:flagellar hook assembly protein FlgD [Alphaproteobacteria bacterium]